MPLDPKFLIWDSLDPQMSLKFTNSLQLKAKLNLREGTCVCVYNYNPLFGEEVS